LIAINYNSAVSNSQLQAIDSHYWHVFTVCSHTQYTFIKLWWGCRKSHSHVQNYEISNPRFI